MKAPPTPRLPPSTNKRLRASDEYDIGNGGGALDAKRSRLDNGSNNSSPVIPPLVQNGLDRSHRDGRELGSDNHAMISMPTTPLTASKKGSKLESDMLKAQISRAQRAGKVKTTKELIENLGKNYLLTPIYVLTLELMLLAVKDMLLIEKLALTS